VRSAVGFWLIGKAFATITHPKLTNGSELNFFADLLKAPALTLLANTKMRGEISVINVINL
jgi:hypothetical protein